jgi:F420H(2)-dependent quinone reductase
MTEKLPRLNYFSVMMYHLTGGRAYSGGPQSPAGFLKLTTIGRKSGTHRTVHLLYIRDGSAYVVTASNAGRPRHPGWFYNLQSNPRVSLTVHNSQVDAVAEVATPEQRSELWQRLLQIAPFYGRYQKNSEREIPMVLLRPVAPSAG